MSWQERTSMMSPAQEREFWLNELKRRMPYGMLVEDGLLLRVREAPGGKCNRTVLRYPEDVPAKS